MNTINNQQKMFQFEKTWYREVMALLQKYEIVENEEEIKKYTKNAWKNMVDKRVMAVVLEELNEKLEKEKDSGKITFPCQTKIKVQEYMKKMTPHDARLLFAVRSRNIDLRGVRTYMYEDTSCRLCGCGVENIDHVINICIHI